MTIDTICSIAAKLLALAAMLGLAGCLGDSSTNRNQTPSTSTSTTLGDLVSSAGPSQTTYRWTGGGVSGGPGTVIWRIDGALSRWDTLFHDTAGYDEGALLILKEENGSSEDFGCYWGVIPDDPSKVLAGCGSGGGGASLMQEFLGRRLPFMADNRMEVSGERTILGASIPCHTGPPIEEICVDDSGRVVYFSARQGDSTTVLEATSVSDRIEPVVWPSIASKSESTGPGPAVMPRESLDLPAGFDYVWD